MLFDIWPTTTPRVSTMVLPVKLQREFKNLSYPCKRQLSVDCSIVVADKIGTEEGQTDVKLIDTHKVKITQTTNIAFK